MPDSEDICYEVGPDAYYAMSRYFNREIENDTVESFKDAIEEINTLIDALGKNDDDSYEYENEMLFRKALMNIRQYLEEWMSRINIGINVCEKALRDINEVCYYQAVTESFLNEWDVETKGEGKDD
jgi:hypothetical protein